MEAFELKEGTVLTCTHNKDKQIVDFVIRKDFDV